MRNPPNQYLKIRCDESSGLWQNVVETTARIIKWLIDEYRSGCHAGIKLLLYTPGFFYYKYSCLEQVAQIYRITGIFFKENCDLTVNKCLEEIQEE